MSAMAHSPLRSLMKYLPYRSSVLATTAKLKIQWLAFKRPDLP